VPDARTLAVFAAAVALFAVVPGPAVVYIVTRSVDQGRLAGVVSALGIATGNLVHVAAATVGLSALLVSSARAFTVVQYLGAAYLVALGVRALLTARAAPTEEASRPRPLARLYASGVVVATLNPKTALFFLAFLPQFVDPAKGAPAAQVTVLGCLLVAITAGSDLLYALVTARAGRWLRGNARVARRQRQLSGAIYLSLGVSAALSGARPTRT
jgi:threonine/homoserine/homoserine lactone efflux protein